MEIIGSEDPRHHWKDITCTGMTVLDLGAGNFGGQHDQDYATTSDYWLQHGATKVYAVDANAADLAVLTDPRIECYCECVVSAEMIADYYSRWQPDMVKCDIEGSEKNLFDLPPDTFALPRAYALETHTVELLDRCAELLHQHGYTVHWIARHEHAPDVHALYATR